MSGNLAGQIDTFLKGYGDGSSPLAGLGSVFVAAGKKYGVDPRLVVGIAGAESSMGEHVPTGTHNAWGWGPGRPFGSWEEGISTVTRGLSSGYISQGRTTPARIATKYAPASDGNDPAHWSGVVSDFMKQMGAAPAAAMAMNTVTPAAAPATAKTAGTKGTAKTAGTGGTTTTTVTTMSPVPSSSVPSRLQLLSTLLPLETQQPSTQGIQQAALQSLNDIATRGHADPLGTMQSLASGAMQDMQTNQQDQGLALLQAISGLEQLQSSHGTPNAPETTTTTTTETTPPSVAQPSVPSPPPNAASTPSAAPTDTPTSPGKTVWPYAPDVYRGRTDQGVDWIQSNSYLAPRSGTIAAIDPTWYRSNAGNWTPAIYLKFDQPVTVNGRTYPGVFFAETSVIPGMKEGDRVEAGQPIAGGSPGSQLAEQGFAAPIGGSWRQAAYGHYSEGRATQAGQDFVDWLSSIRRDTSR